MNTNVQQAVSDRIQKTEARNTIFTLTKKTMEIDDILNELSKDNWEPIHFALPTGYPVFHDRPNDAPATIIFRREKKEL